MTLLIKNMNMKRGKKRVIRQLNLLVESGEVAALIAPNGFGKTTTSFTINMVGLAIRIGSVFFAIPVFGIQGYLWGLLISQLAVSICCSVVLKHLISA